MTLGHASATLTLDLYGHLFPDELEGVAERLDVAAPNSAEDCQDPVPARQSIPGSRTTGQTC
jgi:hypothetical protein